MKTALVIGGANGIGLAVAFLLASKCEKVIIVDRKNPQVLLKKNMVSMEIDLVTTDFEWLKHLSDVDVIFYSAGFGRVAPFERLRQKEIENSFIVNTISAFKILNHFMPNIKSEKQFLCGVMVSIAGRIASPLFSVYSASKAALFRGIEAINTELKMSGFKNRILENVSYTHMTLPPTSRV